MPHNVTARRAVKRLAFPGPGLYAPRMHGLLEDIGLAVIAATVLGILAHRFRQPIILAYLAAGIVIGPYIGPQLVADPQHVEIISEIGLVLLLFIIGLEMNPQHLVRGGRAILIAGLGQVPLSILLGAGFFFLAGTAAGWMDAVYLGAACSLSSTAIVVKALFDKYEINSVSGRLTVGILIFQDLWAILLLSLQPEIHTPGIWPVLSSIGRAAALLAAGFLISKYILSIIFGWLSRAPEMVVAAAIGWCTLFAASAKFAGLSYEMGALIAGISLSSFSYSEHITEKTLPLRDFFLTLFFVSLGMKIPFPGPELLTAVPLVTLFVFVSRLLIVIPLARLGHSGKRTSFLAALNLSQIGEFSLVLAAAGADAAHITSPMIAVILYSMAFASVISSYVLKYNHEIYNFCARLLPGWFKEYVGEEDNGHARADIVVLGLHRTGRALLDQIAAVRPDLLSRTTVVDFSAEVLKAAREKYPVHAVFGDISTQETLQRAGAGKAQWVLSTIPDTLLRGASNLKIVHSLRALSQESHIVATAESRSYVERLIAAGASEVLLPFVSEGEKIAEMVARTLPEEKLDQP